MRFCAKSRVDLKTDSVCRSDTFACVLRRPARAQHRDIEKTNLSPPPSLRCVVPPLVMVTIDNTDFTAVTRTDTKLFLWEFEGLLNMKDVPLLTRFWEFTVLRSLASAGVRHHLEKTDTLYDSLLIPEEKGWLEGAPSRDFESHSRPPTIVRQLKRLASSFQIIPPHGVRHYPGILEPSPVISRMEASCEECNMNGTENTTNGTENTTSAHRDSAIEP